MEEDQSVADRMFFLIKNAPLGLTRAGLGKTFLQLGGLLQFNLTGGRVASRGVQFVTSMIQLGDRKESHLTPVHWQVEEGKGINVEDVEKRSEVFCQCKARGLSSVWGQR